ncbi:MAG: DUF5803 family protein, partial [Halobacteria archaeon]|nr:DUF5803 family protein [Halobacteria archaeon]
NGTEEIEIWKDNPLGGTNPITVGGVRFRHSNGTVVNVTKIEERSGRTVIEIPSPDGTLVYSSPIGSRRFVQPSPIEGSVKVILPEGTDARNFILGNIAPGGYEVVNESPLTLRWDNVGEGSVIDIRYYNEGDVALLMYLLGGLVVAAIGVYLYFRHVLNKLEEQREELGLEGE